MAALAILVAMVLTWRRLYLLLAVWVAALAGATILDIALKHIIHRPSLVFPANVLQGARYCYLSDYAMESLVGYGMLTHFLVPFWTKRPQLKVAIIAAFALLSAAVGFSSLYVGATYFSDLIGGTRVEWYGYRDP